MADPTTPPAPATSAPDASSTPALSPDAAAALRIVEAIRTNAEKTTEEYQKQIKKLEDQADALKVLAKESGNYAEFIRVQNDAKVKSAELELKLAREAFLTNKDSAKAQENLVNAAKKYNDQLKIAEQQSDAIKKGNALGQLLGITEENKNSLTYQIFSNPAKIFHGVNEAISNAGGLMEVFSMSVLGTIQKATLEAIKQQDAAVSSFAAATGASSAYNSVIYETARGNTALGISFQQSGKALTDLYTNLNTFTTLNKDSQKELTITAAKLEKLGISGGDTAKSIQSLSMMMGVSEVQAAKTVEEFAAMGQAIGVSSKQMISDFVAVKDQLAVFGDSMDETFTKLAAQAKATGVAVNDLLTLANKFDTFEGAATQVAKLNAVLGGPYLSAMSMIETTDPTERINMLREAVNNASMSFESMSYYEKKAIMDAGGFKSIEEAQRILSMSAGEAAKELQAQQASQEELNKAIQRAQPIQEKLTMIMSNFAIVMGPTIELLSDFASFLAELADTTLGSFTITMLVAVVAAYKLYQGFLAIRAGIVAMNLALTTSPAGLVILALAAAVGVLYYLFMQKRSSPTLYEFFTMLPNMFASIAMAGLMFGASLLMIAAALPALSIGLLALSFAIMSFANPFVIAGIFVLSEALSTLVEQINKVETEKIINFRVMMEKIVEVSEPSTLKGFEQFSEKFDLVAQATAKIDASKTQTFANMLVATQNLSQALKLNQTVIVKIGDKKFEGIITDTINNIMGDQAISRPAGG